MTTAAEAAQPVAPAAPNVVVATPAVAASGPVTGPVTGQAGGPTNDMASSPGNGMANGATNATSAAVVGATVPSPPPTASMQTPPAPAASAPGASATPVAGLGQIALVLVLVVALIAGMAWLMRRLGVARNGAGNLIRVVSGVSLSNRERILVLEIADQWIVVGVTSAAINTLATLPRQDHASDGTAYPAPAGRNFAHWLQQTMEKRKNGN